MATTHLTSPVEALAVLRSWATISNLGGSSTPLLTVDLRGLGRSFRKDEQDSTLAALLPSVPWVNVAVVDDGIDPVFAPLVAAFDVVIGDATDAGPAVAVDDVEHALGQLRHVVEASPEASVALVQLLRTSHDLPVAQALHAESLTYAVLQTSEVFQHWLRARAGTTPQPDATPPVNLERDGSLLRIQLRRPERRNALNVAMRDALIEALELLDADTTLDGALLTGAGSNFCAGGDLDEFGSTPSPARGHQVRMLRSLSAMVHRVRDRLRVHVHGSCVGAGIELPAFSSWVTAHPDATFRLPEIGFGLVPGAGGTVSITRRCGRHRTAWLALTGTTLDAPTALRWQLIDRIT